MKTKDVYEVKEGFLAFETQKIEKAIQAKDEEFLKDLYMGYAIHSSIESFLICALIRKVLGYDPYVSA